MKPRENDQNIPSLLKKLARYQPQNWNDISEILDALQKHAPPLKNYTREEFWEKARTGTAFWTFDFGIDGVSIEIAKYARCLQDLLGKEKPAEIHFIAGDFHPQADNVLEPGWKRHRVDRVNGWNKWDQGVWFDKLFYQEMAEGSPLSREMAVEIWGQAVEMTGKLGQYLIENEISLLIPVNVNSNPGNLVTGLTTVLVSELLGLYVLNSNHDFYWEGGKPAEERKPGEPPGPRDKFFHNHANQAFFSLFKKIYPWNGRRWIQVNINTLQSQRLIEDGFSPQRVFEISTMVSDEFFKEYSPQEVRFVRQRMAYILSDGEPLIQPVPAASFLENLDHWINNQTPTVCSAVEGLSLDLVSDQIHYFLQPTRIIDRKRIEKDWLLIAALLRDPNFREDFETNQDRQIVLHITGPAPIEHQADLESVLKAYIEVINGLEEPLARRVFMAFSIGTEVHPSFEELNFQKLTIEDIYRLATAVVFPSLTEGRGLPIIESSAAGVPIICSRYQPEEIFAGVVGEDLPPEIQIRYLPFPEEESSDPVVSEIAAFLLDSELRAADNQHNIRATKDRYSRKVMLEAFEDYLDNLRNSN